jgi:transposase
MKILKTYPHFSDELLKKKVDSQTDIRAFKDWQIIYSVQTNLGKQAEEIAGILGIKKSKVYSVIQAYNKCGEGWRTYDKWGGRRDARCHLTLEEEKLLMKSLEDNALQGSILTFRHIKDVVENHVGKEVSDDYVWDLFSRHGWSKKVPRQHHPKADKSAQEEYLYCVRSMKYKKNSKKIWMPNY